MMTYSSGSYLSKSYLFVGDIEDMSWLWVRCHRIKLGYSLGPISLMLSNDLIPLPNYLNLYG